jgi:protein O-GlcNAc transferase
VIDPELQTALADMRAGRTEEAVKATQRILTRRPNDPTAIRMLAQIFLQSGQLESALPYLKAAVDGEPRASDCRYNYANALLQLGRFAEAAEEWEQTVQLAPQLFVGWLGLANARLRLHDSAAARAAAERALALRPNCPQTAHVLALALAAGDEVEAAVAACERVLAAAPQAANLRSTCLLLLNYFSEDNQRLFEAHREFGGQHARPLRPALAHADADRSLRIGVLSADLRTHSVAFVAEPILRYAPAWAKLIIFSVTDSPHDPITRRLQSFGHRWIAAGSLDDGALNKLIRAEQIDVLLDLNGHTAGHRLPALADKPAPVIITALGYPNTTGLTAVDWRLVDSITDPPGAEAFCTERLLRLDPCFLCYAPPRDAPEPRMPPADAPITFGSFNTLAKVSQTTLRLWNELLAAVPESRLSLKALALADASTRDHFRHRLRTAGIAPERCEIAPQTPTMAEHLSAYGHIHVALDPTPYNGTATTCEALWMGVPVVSLAGDRHASRVGASLLRAIGKSEFISQSPENYVAIASRLARDRSALGALRFSLRETMRASPLLDGSGYAERFYAALRRCWVDWCTAQA